MPPVTTTEHLLERTLRRLFSRRVFLGLGLIAVAFCVFAVVDAVKVRPSDGTVWLLGRPTLTILQVVPRSDAAPTPLRRDDKIQGIAHQLVNSPRDAAEVLGLAAAHDLVADLDLLVANVTFSAHGTPRLVSR